MTCGQTREYLFAFLDNELDAPLSIELQRHIDGCAECAREAEIERAVQKHLSGALETAVPGIQDLEFRIQNLEFRSRKPWYVAAAAAIALFVGASAWFVLDETNASPSFVDLLVADFEHFLEDGEKLQVASAQHEAVAEWLLGKTMIAVALPAPADRQIKLLGGRKCTIGDQPAAFAVYDMGGAPASWVAVKGDANRLDGMNEVHFGGETYRVGRVGGFTVVAHQHDGLVCAAVSTLSQEQLLSLMTGAVHESD